MQNALPNISDQHREHLQKRGVKVYQPAPLAPSLDPFSNTYWQINAALLSVSVLGRFLAGKSQAPRIFWSASILAIPFYALISRSRVDSLDEIAGARKTLEQKLEYSPITRRAWVRALETNEEYQEQLRQEIVDLQASIAQKKLSSQ